MSDESGESLKVESFSPRVTHLSRLFQLVGRPNKGGHLLLESGDLLSRVYETSEDDVSRALQAARN